jgi:tetratricopeptide (TPR) repeat protein
MNVLGLGLDAARHHEDALSVQEADFSTLERLGGPEAHILAVQNNLANTYQELERHEDALLMRQEVYSRRLQLDGEEHRNTLRAANNYAMSLIQLKRFEEAKSMLRKAIPVARRVLGENDYLTLQIRRNYARALYNDDDATLDDLREAVTTLEETERTARRVLSSAHPLTAWVESNLRYARAALRARETPPPTPSRL